MLCEKGAFLVNEMQRRNLDPVKVRKPGPKTPHGCIGRAAAPLLVGLRGDVGM